MKTFQARTLQVRVEQAKKVKNLQIPFPLGGVFAQLVHFSFISLCHLYEKPGAGEGLLKTPLGIIL